MSERYPGGVISQTGVTPTPSSAPGIWTLDQQLQAQKAGTWPFGGPFTYIEDVFSTWLYTGNGSTQTITNGIDLSTYGGMVWTKARTAAYDAFIYDTARGANNRLIPSSTAASATGTNYLNSFNVNGFTLGSNEYSNFAPQQSASWTFRKQPKFFDVVTYTGDGVAGRTVAHNLGSTPGCIIVKATSAANDWLVYHTSLGNTQGMSISSTSAAQTSTTYWNNTSPTSTQFTVGTSPRSNENGTTFVAYLFAHNAGGFGLTGTDNVISCGSFTTDGSGIASVTLGYEPQYLLVKRTNSTSDWYIWDSMRGLTMDVEASLFANSSAAEEALVNFVNPTATGFVTVNGLANSSTYIYIAIRRGPMKTPTSGTSVFSPVARAGTNSQTNVNSGFPPDLYVPLNRDHLYFANNPFFDRLRGLVYLNSNSTAIETDGTPFLVAYGQNGTTITNSGLNNAATTYIDYFFRRAPGFFDEVCYTGTGAATTFNHNLGVAPELMIVKSRSGTTAWTIYNSTLGNNASLAFSTGAVNTPATQWNTTSPTSTVFSIGTSAAVNGSGSTYVNYLFASCPGVSKVGSYSGTGATQTISCGFAARFVMIKRTDSTGDWWIWDTARGMVAGTDPRLALNSTAAETNANWVYTDAAGFQIVTTDATVNASGGTYIYLAIA